MAQKAAMEYGPQYLMPPTFSAPHILALNSLISFPQVGRELDLLHTLCGPGFFDGISALYDATVHFAAPFCVQLAYDEEDIYNSYPESVVRTVMSK